MLSRWRIRRKLMLALILLVAAVGTLSFSSFRGVYAYRGLAKAISNTAVELDLPSKLARYVSNMRESVSQLVLNNRFPDSPAQSNIDSVQRQMFGQRFRVQLESVETTVDAYSRAITGNSEPSYRSLDDTYRDERRKLLDIRHSVATIQQINAQPDWIFDETAIGEMSFALVELHNQAADLPTILQDKMKTFALKVRRNYRTWIALTWFTTFLSIPLLFLMGLCLYGWIFRPLRTILRGSRLIASGDFDHRVKIAACDEMGEVANALNQMTSMFQRIRDDLDHQVQQRTKEVVRSERLASVGFLAAGVAHEINNPLASIALCAESLEDRVQDIIQVDDALPDEEHNQDIAILRNYLRMIQDEAFRCKQITQGLLDFSRLGDVQKQCIDVTQLVTEVIEMLKHVGQYKGKKIRFRTEEPVFASVNSQEMKQVVLNLLTNAMDSLGPGGHVDVIIHRTAEIAELVVKDDGCGMTQETKEHLFEPFFTRRRDGQGTGLGMSITYRIVQDHGGTIRVESAGLNQGSTITVQMPVDPNNTDKERQHRHDTAA